MLNELVELETRGTVRDVAAIASRYGKTNDWAHAVHALKQILSRARARDFIWLESNARSALGSSSYYGSPWLGLDPTGVARLPGAAQRLAAFHANGRVREAAVRALASTDDSDVIPYLLLRANDWVAQVSDCACDALEDRLRPTTAAAWIAALPFEQHVRALRRRVLGHLFDKARAILIDPMANAALHDAMRSGTTDVRRACLSLVASLPSDERARVLALAVRDDDPVVASRAAAALFEGSSDVDSHEIAFALLHHRVARVRALAITALWAQFPAEAFQPSRAALVDAARCVREVAQFELRRHHGVDVAGIYASALPTARGRELLAVLDGLTESGTAQHAALLARFVDEPSPRVKCAALRALSRLDGDAHTRAFVDALMSSSPRVTRVGLEALDKRAHLVERATLDALLEAGGPPARAVLTLLPQLDFWGSLLVALHAVANPELRETANRVIVRLVARQTYSLPADHGAIENAFMLVRADLSIPNHVKALLELTTPSSPAIKGNGGVLP